MPVIIGLVQGEMPNLKNIDKGTLKRMVMYIRQKVDGAADDGNVVRSYPRSFVNTKYINRDVVVPVYNDVPRNRKSHSLQLLLNGLTKATKGKLIQYLVLHYKDQRRARFGLKVPAIQCRMVEEKDSCAICMEAFTEDTRTTTTNCGHLFCTTCFTRAILTSYTPSCPMCRNPLN
uniref:RING-type domain-containing protein n=1 Tax=viral metagenome TaxID=1070528 RepID=A0A6C0BU41_9ZZZZ